MDDQDLTIYWILEGAPISFKDLRAEEILSPQELGRWKAMRFEKRRDEFLLGRYTAKRLLASPQLPWANASFQSLEILNESDGAPYLNDPAIQGSLSISHRVGTAAAAYSLNKDHQVGIDLELIERRAWSFVEDFFTPEEARFARSLPEHTREIAVTLIWSAKEAILKAWRKGLRLDTRIVEIQPLEQEEIDLLDCNWVRMRAEVQDSDLLPCEVFGRVLGDTLLTLAYTNTQPKKLPAQIELTQVNT